MTLKTVRVLIVDDNLDHMHLALRGLRDDPRVEVEMARHGKEALRLVEEKDFHLLILDYRLPDMTGLDVMEHVDVPVILMTSQGSEEVAMRALDQGALNYVVKDGNLGKRLHYEIERFVEENP